MKNEKLRRNILISLLAVTFVVILVFAGRRGNSEPTAPDLFDASIPRGVTEDGYQLLGQAEAPVSMVLYEDMGCPNCRMFEQTVEPEIIKDFVESGDVNIQVVTLAFVNRESLSGAEAVACAAEQEKFWEYRAVLFKNQGVRGFTRQNLVEIAKEINLDLERFSSCFDLQKHSKAIIDRTQKTFEFGIEATPTFEINGKRYVGVYPYEPLESGQDGVKAFIQEALAEVSP